MKKFRNCVLFLSLILGIAIMPLSKSYSTDWEDFTPSPCDFDYEDAEPWDGPKEWIICADTVADLNCNGCCFTVVYYDRFDERIGPMVYEVNVTGVFYHCEVEDNNCPVEDVIDAFYEKLIQYSVRTYSEFWEENIFGDPCSNSSGYGPFLYTTGKCINTSTGEECTPSPRCCISQYEYEKVYESGSNPCKYFITSTDYYQVIGQEPECNTSPCTEEKCRTEVLYQPLGSVVCEIPCNQGQWTMETEPNLAIPGCPDCYVDVEYRYRETVGCSPVFYDIEILSIDFQSDDCKDCTNLDATEIYQYVHEWALMNAAIERLDIGDCDTTIRALRSSCWRFKEGGYKFSPCEVSDCCWARYRVCRTGQDSYIWTLWDYGSESDTCDYPTEPCEFLCDVIPMPKKGISDVDDSGDPLTYAIPNPAENIISIYYQNSESGLISIEIFDNKGQKVFDRDFTKEVKLFITDVDISVFTPGLYNYIIKDKSRIFNGRFIINR